MTKADVTADGSQMNTLENALATLLEGICPLESELIHLSQADGRILAQEITATIDSPPFDSSAMDGYALHTDDSGKTLRVSQRIAAGDVPKPLQAGTCARIFTGAPLPEGSNCVVMQEQVVVDEDGIKFPDELVESNNIRFKGRETRQGEILLACSQKLNPIAIGICASQGYSQLEVHRQPRVALFSTGDELLEPGMPHQPGHIYDSNRFMMAALLRQFGFDVALSQHLPDDQSVTASALVEAAENTDVVITMGGVSVGEEDHVRAALMAHGTLDVWKLNIQPGKPLALGQLVTPSGKHAQFVGLAGNPVSSYVGAWLFLRPLAGHWLNCNELKQLSSVAATANFTTKTKGRWHYMRAQLDLSRQDNSLSVNTAPDQDSSRLSSCLHANALAVIPPQHEVHIGDPIECLLLRD